MSQNIQINYLLYMLAIKLNTNFIYQLLFCSKYQIDCTRTYKQIIIEVITDDFNLFIESTG